MAIAYDEVNLTANGGTEMMLRGLEARLPAELLDNFVISRSIEKLYEARGQGKKRIYWCHEVPPSKESGQAEYQVFMQRAQWKLFDNMVFVSNWQMNEFLRRLPFNWDDWGRLQVLLNAIDPIPEHTKPTDKIRLIHTSSSDRGLWLVYDVIDRVSKVHPDVELNVYSGMLSYKDAAEEKFYTDLYKRLSDHPNVNFYGRQPNDVVRQALQDSHIYMYPCQYGETSCISLIEAMSAGLDCIHSNNAALFETAGGITNMYHYERDQAKHVEVCTQKVIEAIQNIKDEKPNDLKLQKAYADKVFSWEARVPQWTAYLNGLLK